MAGTASVCLRPLAGATVIAVAGSLDQAAVQPCRAALDLAIGCGGPIVVDLEQVAPPVAAAVPLLGAMRRYVRKRQTTMVLAAVPMPLIESLEQAGVHRLYELAPTTTQALHLLGVPVRPDEPASWPAAPVPAHPSAAGRSASAPGDRSLPGLADAPAR